MEKLIGKKMTGCLVISLDFEMMWGNLERWTIDGYGSSNVSNVRNVINRMIDLFEKYGIHATFATVGLLYFKNKQEANSCRPDMLPTYDNDRLSPYANSMISNIPDEAKDLYFAPDIVNKLKLSQNVEIGTHTFSHFYCWEKGQTVDQFSSDLKMANKIAEENGVCNLSIVFPRNNVSDTYLDICAENGILVYRGNPKKYFNKTNRLVGAFVKVLRFLDVYINTANKTSYPYSELNINSTPINIPASRFLRPYSPKLKCLEGLRFRRIKRELVRAAKNNEIYHLWWHPHNFGSNMDENFTFLEKVLKCYIDCHNKYGMDSLTMKELYYKFKN